MYWKAILLLRRLFGLTSRSSIQHHSELSKSVPLHSLFVINTCTLNLKNVLHRIFLLNFSSRPLNSSQNFSAQIKRIRYLSARTRLNWICGWISWRWPSVVFVVCAQDNTKWISAVVRNPCRVRNVLMNKNLFGKSSIINVAVDAAAATVFHLCMNLHGTARGNIFWRIRIFEADLRLSNKILLMRTFDTKWIISIFWLEKWKKCILFIKFIWKCYELWTVLPSQKIFWSSVTSPQLQRGPLWYA